MHVETDPNNSIELAPSSTYDIEFTSRCDLDAMQCLSSLDTCVLFSVIPSSKWLTLSNLENNTDRCHNNKCRAKVFLSVLLQTAIPRRVCLFFDSLHDLAHDILCRK